MDFDNEEEFKGRSDDNLADEYPAATNQDMFQHTFGSSKPGQNDIHGNPIITIIDRSSVHEIGMRWCCCLDALECNMQLMAAGLFLATFRNPKTAFTFQALQEFHLDNLECKTTPSQFISRLRRLTSDEFPNTVPVGQASSSAYSRLTGRYRTSIESS
jgi:CxC2 like cysteine cluster associated with KDZ transposases